MEIDWFLKPLTYNFELESLITAHYKVSNKVPIALNRHPMPVLMSELNMIEIFHFMIIKTII